MLWLENLFSQAIIERFGWMLVHFLWQAAVVAMLLAVFLRLLRRSGANVRYVTACSALAMMVVLPAVTMLLIEASGSAAEAGPEPATGANVASWPPATVVQASDESAISDDSLEMNYKTAAVPWNERIASALRPALPYGVLGWLAGVFGLSTWHLGGWMQLQRLKRRMTQHVGAALQRQLAQIASRIGVSQAVTLLESAIVEVPTVVGWLRPVILLPASALTGLSPEQLEAILAHELAHIRRYDYLVNVLQTVVEILGFYHPAVWWVSRRIRIERENCCDDTAVRVCGDSVRYARALTCLEEIRHGQAELAMAATGGSLLDRVARLLGRPAPDDRRFTWLPGLIALLLVAAVVIPAALALAGPSSTPPESPTNDAVALMDTMREEPGADDPCRAEIVIDYTLVEVTVDRTLDSQAMTDMGALLLRRPPANVYRVTGPLPQLTVEELQRPLGDILRDSMVARDKDTELVDLLVSRGYARSTSKSTLEVLPGKQASFALGAIQDANALQPPEGASSLTMDTKVDLANDPNTLVVATRLTLTFPATDSGEPNVQMTTTEISSTGIIPNGGSLAIIERSAARQDDEAAPKRLHILLVQPTLVHKPGTAPRLDVSTEPPNQLDSTENKARVLLSTMIVTANEDSPLDAETAIQVENLLGSPIRLGGQSGQRPAVTVGEVLREHVTQKVLPEETLRALAKLLVSRGHVMTLSRPQVMAWDGVKASIRIVNEQHFYTAPPADDPSGPAKLEKVEAGMRLDLTPHVGDQNAITVEIHAEVTDMVQRPIGRELPIVRRRTNQTVVTMLGGDAFTCRVAGQPDKNADTQDEGPVYIMVAPSVVREPQASPPRSDGDLPALAANGRNANLRTEVVGEPNASERERRQVAIVVGILGVTEGKRLDNKTALQIERILGEQIRPRNMGGPFWHRRSVTVGEVLRKHVLWQHLSLQSVDELIHLLIMKRYATALANPRVVTRDGEEALTWIGSREPVRVESSDGEHAGRAEIKMVDVGVKVCVTPHVGDQNNITVSLTAEVTDILPRPGHPDLSIIRCRTADQTFTISSGRYFVSTMPTTATGMVGKEESLYIMVMPSIVKLPDANQVRADDGDGSDSANKTR